MSSTSPETSSSDQYLKKKKNTPADIVTHLDVLYLGVDSRNYVTIESHDFGVSSFPQLFPTFPRMTFNNTLTKGKQLYIQTVTVVAYCKVSTKLSVFALNVWH